MFPALSAVTFPGSWLTLCPLPRDPCSQSSLGCLSQPRGTCHVHPWWDIAVPDLAFSFYTSKNPTQRLGNATRCCLPGGCLPGCSAQPWGHPSPGLEHPPCFCLPASLSSGCQGHSSTRVLSVQNGYSQWQISQDGCGLLWRMLQG